MYLVFSYFFLWHTLSVENNYHARTANNGDTDCEMYSRVWNRILICIYELYNIQEHKLPSFIKWSVLNSPFNIPFIIFWYYENVSSMIIQNWEMFTARSKYRGASHARFMLRDTNANERAHKHALLIRTEKCWQTHIIRGKIGIVEENIILYARKKCSTDILFESHSI